MGGLESWSPAEARSLLPVALGGAGLVLSGEGATGGPDDLRTRLPIRYGFSPHYLDGVPYGGPSCIVFQLGALMPVATGAWKVQQ